MATVKVVDVISKAQTLLKDATGVRWPSLELQGWLNDAYRETVIFRPDSNAQTGTYACVAGPRQQITSTFAAATQLMDVVRNVASASDKSPVKLITRQTLDDMDRSWYGNTGAVTIERYAFDPRLPREFLVYPPAAVGAQLEVVYSSVPAAHTLTETQLNNSATAEVIRIDDSFGNVLIDYVMYRAYSKDAEVAANSARAVAHYQAFQNGLGIKGQSEAASRPGVAQ
jgi:hypothetical protein